MKKLIIVVAVLLTGGFAVAGNPFEVDQFISPETCGDCHGEIYDQWKHSMHNLSHNDPVYLTLSGFVISGLTDQNEIDEAESCVKCHTPVGNVTGFPLKTSDDRKKVPEIATKGIQCDYCHSVTGVKQMFNNGLTLSPGNGEDDPGIKRGPRKDSESDFHETAYSEIHTGSEICGTCHNVNHVAFGTPLETTYDEWKNSPYNTKDKNTRVTCQGCHMYQRPGIPATGSTDRPENKGYAADDGPERDHVFTHYFVGANSYVPGLSNDSTKAVMAEERLKNAATLSLVKERIAKGVLEIVVTNSGAGHKLPTGLTDVRQMWLEILVTNEKGETLLSSGTPDKNNHVPDGALMFNTVFGDGKGKPVLNIAKAREVLIDDRIRPLESVSRAVTFDKGNSKTLVVKARLLYRSAPQHVLDSVAGKGKVKPPVVTMEEINETIEL